VEAENEQIPLKLALLVTRNWDVFVLKIDTCPRVWRQGMVCDGELVNIDNQWTWLGFDAIILSGIPVWKEPLSTRLRYAQLAWKDYGHTKGELSLQWKQFYQSVHDYQSAMKMSSMASDGVILTPEQDPVRVGRHRRLFKLKHNDKHTVDFMITDGRDLHVFNPAGKVHVKVAMLSSPVEASDGTIIECSFTDASWSFVCYRTDKSTANDVLTYNKTLVNIEEQLTIHDLM